MDRYREDDEQKLLTHAKLAFWTEFATIPAGYWLEDDHDMSPWMLAAEFGIQIGVDAKSITDLLRVLYARRPRPGSLDAARREVDIVQFAEFQHRYTCSHLGSHAMVKVNLIAKDSGLDQRRVGQILSDLGVRRYPRKGGISTDDYLKAMLVMLAKEE